MIEKLFAKNNNTFIQFFRYTIVGGIAFMFDFSFLFIFTEFFKIQYLISASIAFIIGVVINYLLSITWVFSKRKLEDKKLEFFLFFLIGISGLLLNEFIMWFFTEKINFYYLNSKLISTLIVYFFNFFLRKYLLFK